RPGSLDVLAQYVLGRACGAPFAMDELYAEVQGAAPYSGLAYQDVERVVDFVATGGYALRRYEEHHKLQRLDDGRFKVASAKVARQYRMNAGTIVEAPMIRVRRLARGRKKAAASVGRRPVGRPGAPIGEIEEWFIDQLRPGDTFLFAGQVWRYEGLSEKEAYATRAQEKDPMIPAYQGGKFPLSTFLAARVRRLLADSRDWSRLPDQVEDWLKMQRKVSAIPGPEQMLIETFPRGGKFYMVCYPFEGRLAHQSLGMLLTQRLEEAGYQPLGFTASDYALAIWGLQDMAGADMAALFAREASEEVLEDWLASSSLFKRAFRNCAVIAGLINRRHPGQEKTGRQVTFSADLIYDVLRRYEPDHVLLQAARDDVGSGLIDLARLRQLLERLGARDRLLVKALDRVSPLSVPVMLDIGRESVPGSADEALLAEAADELIAEAQA
ncbi:MAG: DNA ligase-associated DEXH box helicase, partial [Alphaproteobacteria bacterium]|nr:DNA ligase-associated DEXH box helicase [Alphaproteobacteria bacterium]